MHENVVLWTFSGDKPRWIGTLWDERVVDDVFFDLIKSEGYMTRNKNSGVACLRPLERFVICLRSQMSISHLHNNTTWFSLVKLAPFVKVWSFNC